LSRILYINIAVLFVVVGVVVSNSQKEEEKRKEKIADWERHQQGKGYKSKYRAPDTPVLFIF